MTSSHQRCRVPPHPARHAPTAPHRPLRGLAPYWGLRPQPPARSFTGRLYRQPLSHPSTQEELSRPFSNPSRPAPMLKPPTARLGEAQVLSAMVGHDPAGGLASFARQPNPLPRTPTTAERTLGGIHLTGGIQPGGSPRSARWRALQAGRVPTRPRRSGRSGRSAPRPSLDDEVLVSHPVVRDCELENSIPRLRERDD